MSIDHNSFFYSLPWIDVLIPFLVRDLDARKEDKSLDVARELSFFQPITYSPETVDCENLPASSLFAYLLDPGLYEFVIPNNLTVTVRPCSLQTHSSQIGRQYYPEPYGLLALESKSFITLTEGNEWHKAIANFHKYERQSPDSEYRPVYVPRQDTSMISVKNLILKAKLWGSLSWNQLL